MDVVVVGSGPNGLTAACALARAGLRVVVLEAADSPGGAARTAEITLPGFRHDLGSAVHPLGVASPAFRSLALGRFGLEWVWPEFEAAHPLDGGRAAVLVRDVGATADGLGDDAETYRRNVGALARGWESWMPALLGPLWPPRGPLVEQARFGMSALRSAGALSRSWFRTEEARALVAGMAAHSALPLERTATAAIALVLLLAAHGRGWPFPRGGAGAITDALVACLHAHGGRVECERRVRSMDDLPDTKAVLFDLAPTHVVAIAGERLPRRYRDRLLRFRHGPGVFKIDWALDGPIPWTNLACRRAGTLHVGGTLEEIADAERAPWRGACARRPFVLLAQPTVFDPTRAPADRHVAWAYAHVPSGSDDDRTEAIEAQVERFAPGFRDRILARATRTATRMEAWNANLVGGDVTGGVNDVMQTIFRPRAGRRAYATPDRSLYLGSSSTPPGGGVHGMCGWHAARLLADRSFGIDIGGPAPPD